MKNYSLYIHIPFCQKKCNYCDFTSYAGLEHLMEPYIAALKNELIAYSNLLEAPRIRSVYFGGGTPSLLKEAAIDEIMELFRENFIPEEKIEISMEVNPGTVNLAKLSALKSAGINRLSIGGQSFNDEKLKTLGRIHTSSQIYYTYTSARSAGFTNINIDLMFALPGQDPVDWGNTLKKAISLGPEHISTYNLVIEEGTPLPRTKRKTAFARR